MLEQILGQGPIRGIEGRLNRSPPRCGGKMLFILGERTEEKEKEGEVTS